MMPVGDRARPEEHALAADATVRISTGDWPSATLQKLLKRNALDSQIRRSGVHDVRRC